MRVLALNCGSSSLKCALVDTDSRQRLLELRIEAIGASTSQLVVADSSTQLAEVHDIATATRRLLDEVKRRSGNGVQPQAVAHRVVHGGERFVQPVQLDEHVLAEIDQVSELAPLHNPPALAAIRIARTVLSDLPHVAVFDTAFHSSLPPRSREYALPRALVHQFGIRRYGFHGTSHAHIMQAVAAAMSVAAQTLRIISCHLGNGASVAAIEYGRSVDTSMGMTPLEGLVMGSRSGDVDPGVLLRLLSTGEYSHADLDTLLNSQSGLKGMTDSNNMRDIEARALQGDQQCRLAIAVYAHRVRKYIGAYVAVMGGVDAIAFTGGVGENSVLIRHRALQRFDFLGAILDEDRNRDVAVRHGEAIASIAADNSRVHLFVVPADEELSIAEQAARCLDAATDATPIQIPVAISARHAHLSQATIDHLFGAGYQLQVRAPLSQTGQFAAEETVNLIGPRGRIDHVRVLGPPRSADQIEISRSDEFVLGIDAPIRISGDVSNSPGITLESAAARVSIVNGVICAWRHIHMNADEACQWGLHDHDKVQVRIVSDARSLVFNDVIVRIDPSFRLELHLDTDEANAAGIAASHHDIHATNTRVTAVIVRQG